MSAPEISDFHQNTQALISDTLALPPGLALSKLYDNWRVCSKETQDIFVSCLIGEAIALRQLANLRSSSHTGASS